MNLIKVLGDTPEDESIVGDMSANTQMPNAATSEQLKSGQTQA